MVPLAPRSRGSFRRTAGHGRVISSNRNIREDCPQLHHEGPLSSCPLLTGRHVEAAEGPDLHAARINLPTWGPFSTMGRRGRTCVLGRTDSGVLTHGDNRGRSFHGTAAASMTSAALKHLNTLLDCRVLNYHAFVCSSFQIETLCVTEQQRKLIHSKYKYQT